TVSYTDMGTIYLLQSGGGGGGPTQSLYATAVEQMGGRPNRLFTQRPLRIQLPAGSHVERRASGSLRMVEIRTPCSHILVSFAPHGGGTFDGAMNPAAVTLRKRLALPERTPALW